MGMRESAVRWWVCSGFAGLCLAFASPGCSGGGGGSQACVPGTTNLCFCPGQTTGVQTCNQNGTGYEPCQCGTGGTDASTPQDTGSEPDTAGSEDTGGTPDTAGVDTGGECLGNWEKKCDGNEIYWYDSCGKQLDFVQACIEGSSCVAAECISVCTPHADQDCHDGNVFWYDSCGQPESVFKICTEDEFCLNQDCVKAVYNGTYLVTADPDMKEIPLLGSATFPPTLVEVTVTSGVATVELKNYVPPVTYEGTMEGKVMTVGASFTDSGGATHDDTMVVTFFEPNEFSGTLTEMLGVDIGTGEITPIGTLVWSVTGVKQ